MPCQSYGAKARFRSTRNCCWQRLCRLRSAAGLSLVGVVLGAGLQFLGSRSAERVSRGEGLRAAAYSEYLRAVAASGHARSDGDLSDARRDAADAKARIAVYGSATVVGALARFEQTGAALATQESQKTFVTLVSQMRPEGEGVAPRDLELVLFGPGPSIDQ